ncbi:MFS general substrate transporter [Westerdykella ornata]|uniref:MFS general substrate transporter n=1 Tax=Westerdykella ornata TaxID=318751 RepID=A0A6A6JQN3_WESOR|nr:MFS general substrate transporter [Westerdykella ornata]KAF2278941.1 MFS general substrate transporter [Westerdykella ornata]
MTGSLAVEASERTPLLRPRRSVESLKDVTTISTRELSRNGEDIPHRKAAVDEEAPPERDADAAPTEPNASITRIISVLLIGGFISNADGSLLLATHPVIASEFNALDASTWLLTSFSLASSATQPLYGKLSDIYGRRTLLVVAYALFAVGLVLVGLGTRMSHLILGRIISGMGASGMTVLVSIVITDLLPLRDVASWRSYVNIVSTTGRSIGGPLGGGLTDTVGWRWSFLLQLPFALLGIFLILLTLPSDTTHNASLDPDPEPKSQSKLARIDFVGATLMTLTILSFLFPLELGGVKVPWSHPLIPGLVGGGCVFGGLFLVSQAWWAREPIFPVELLRVGDFVRSVVVMACLIAGQMGMMSAVPLYFQITAHASNSVAGAHLVPAVVGNAIGGVLAGAVIKRTGNYKPPILLSTLSASLSYLLLLLRWHGSTSFLESLYIIPGGFGSGIAQSALFISVQAAIPNQYMAVAASALYLSASVGMMAGMAGAAAVLQGVVRGSLGRRLGEGGLGLGMGEIVDKATSDVRFIDHATPRIAALVVKAYVEALAWTHGMLLLVPALTAA